MMEELIDEMMACVCDTLCKHVKECENQEELDRKCDLCEMSQYIDRLKNC